MTKYLTLILLLATASTAYSDEVPDLPYMLEPSINGERILAEGEILATRWRNVQFKNWEFIVRYAGRIWKCEERIGYISCEQMGRR